MEEKSFKNGLSLMWQGLKMSFRCAVKAWWKSVINALVDTARGIVKHPVETLIVVGVMVWQFVIICQQREQRDRDVVNEYKKDCTLDSLQTQADFQQHYIATLKNDTNRITTGSKGLN